MLLVCWSLAQMVLFTGNYIIFTPPGYAYSVEFAHEKVVLFFF